MRFIPPKTLFLRAAGVGLSCAISSVLGCDGSKPPAGGGSEAKPEAAVAAGNPTGKSKSKLKNVSPLGELGVRELRALKKAQKAQEADQKSTP